MKTTPLPSLPPHGAPIAKSKKENKYTKKFKTISYRIKAFCLYLSLLKKNKDFRHNIQKHEHSVYVPRELLW